MSIKLKPFYPEDQDTVRELILEGLKEHWDVIDGSKNPDLNNISVSYRDGVFLVAWKDDEIVGTGAFLPCSRNTVKVVRMSVRGDLRRRGIGNCILTELCNIAYQSGYKRMILETTKMWQGVIEFYKTFGFRITHCMNEDIYFCLDLEKIIKSIK